MQVFHERQLDWPVAELPELLPQLAPESEFVASCWRLQELGGALDKNQFSPADCFAAERQLTFLLRQLAFLAQYRMVSIKDIAYQELRNTAPHYLHSYTVLGIDSKRNVNAERVNYVEAPISTQAILLFRGAYQKNVNLFPFLIDLNALTGEVGAKVCFYSHQDLTDGSLNYLFIDDNSLVNITYRQTWKEGEDMNLLLLDPERRTAYNLDSVFLQFQAAKQALLPGIAAADGDFDFLNDADDEFNF